MVVECFTITVCEKIAPQWFFLGERFFRATPAEARVGYCNTVTHQTIPWPLHAALKPGRFRLLASVRPGPYSIQAIGLIADPWPVGCLYAAHLGVAGIFVNVSNRRLLRTNVSFKASRRQSSPTHTIESTFLKRLICILSVVRID